MKNFRDWNGDESFAPVPNLYFSDSELAKRILAYDWSKTQLGVMSTWPNNLRVAISICLATRFPMFVWWGEDLVYFYNDAYIPMLGHKHPTALGNLGRVMWPEVMPVVEPMIHQVFQNKTATWEEDILMFFSRELLQEEVYVTFSLSPIFEEDKVGGILGICTDTTQKLISHRRLETLRLMGTRTSESENEEEACKNSALALAENLYDIPFSAIYKISKDNTHLALTALSGIDEKNPHPFISSIYLDEKDESIWQLKNVFITHRKVEVDLVDMPQPLPGGPWPEPTIKAFVLPLLSATSDNASGCLIIGVNPRRVLDENYISFFELIARQISSAIADAQAYEAERKRAEELDKIDKAKTIFFSNVSHEFRTPLTLILAPIEDMLEKFTEFNKNQIYLELQTVHRNSYRLLKLVNTLLDFSRVEAKRIVPKFELTDFSLFIEELASVFRSTIESAGITYSVHCELLDGMVYIDREMWEKIIFNLLSNAFKFTFEGEIELTLKPEGQHIIISIRDTGTGIREDQLPRIFERFHRVEGAKSRTYEGSGIGLALVQELVHIHQGQITVRSRLGSGTNFTITIPLQTVNPLSVSVSEAQSSYESVHAASYVEEAARWLPTNAQNDFEYETATSTDVENTVPARILIADDNADMREYLARILTEKWLVETVADGSVALEVLRNKKFDLVLTDVMMPGLDGFSLLKEIRSDNTLCNIPVIMLSARAGLETRVDGLHNGADDYLIKPFSAKEIVARVAAQLKLALRHHLSIENEILRREKEEAERNNQTKDLFLAALSHELRTPMTVILCCLQVLKTQFKTESAADKAIKSIEENALVQKRLINDLLDVSSIILDKISIQLKKADLISIIRFCIESMKLNAEKKFIRISLDTDTPELIMDLDEDRIHQVFYNLINNAIKFTPPNGAIEIRVRSCKSRVCIEVEDNGQGISPELLPCIFDKFIQGKPNPNQLQEGLGLGLALVRSFVELHKGTIKVESPGLNMGTTFTINFKR